MSRLPGRPSGPRIRTIKPERYQDERMAGVSRDARHLYDGLTVRADDEGRGSANPALIRANWAPYDDDVTNARVVEWLDELESAGLVQLYEAGDGRTLFQIVSWGEDQRIDHPSMSKLQKPPGAVSRDDEDVRDSSQVSREELEKAPAGPDPDLDRTGPERERERGHAFTLDLVDLSNGDLARLDGSAFVQKRIDGAAGGWARDHVSDIHPDDAIRAIRGLLAARTPATPTNVRAAAPYFAADLMVQTTGRRAEADDAVALLAAGGVDPTEAKRAVHRLQKERPWVLAAELADHAKRLIPSASADQAVAA